MKQFLRKALQLTLLIGAVNTVKAQTQLIHYWNFNRYTTANVHINNMKADYSAIDTNKAMISTKPFAGTVSDTGYIDNYIPTNLALDTPNINLNSKMGASAGAAIRMRNPSDSMEMRFYIPTTGYKNIVLKYMSESSSATSGQKVQAYDYSVDSGATWRTTGLTKKTDTTDNATFKLVTVPFSDAADTSIKGNSKLVFRIKFIGQNTGTSGNNRFDNVTIEGDSITAVTPPTDTTHTPSAINNIDNNAAYSIYPNPATNSIALATPTEGIKDVSIINSFGQKVYTATHAKREIVIDVNQLAAGAYYILIMEHNGAQMQSVKFIKQ